VTKVYLPKLSLLREVFGKVGQIITKLNLWKVLKGDEIYKWGF